MTHRRAIKEKSKVANRDWVDHQACSLLKYTETIKLCPLDVYVCQFQLYERILVKFSHYTL